MSFFLMQNRIQQVFWAVRPHCWLMFSLLSTSMSSPFLCRSILNLVLMLPFFQSPGTSLDCYDFSIIKISLVPMSAISLRTLGHILGCSGSSSGCKPDLCLQWEAHCSLCPHLLTLLLKQCVKSVC